MLIDENDDENDDEGCLGIVNGLLFSSLLLLIISLAVVSIRFFRSTEAPKKETPTLASPEPK